MKGEQRDVKEASGGSTDEIKLVAYIKNMIEEGRASGSRIAHEGIWMTNTAYVLGFDSVYYEHDFKTV